MVNLVSIKTSDSFSTNLLSIWVAPSLYWVQDFVLPLAELHKIQPVSPAYPGLSVWQHDTLVYPLLLTVLCHLQTC